MWKRNVKSPCNEAVNFTLGGRGKEHGKVVEIMVSLIVSGTVQLRKYR